jgi:ferredoxin
VDAPGTPGVAGHGLLPVRAAPQPGARFDVTLAVSGKTIRVDEQQSLLEAIEAAGVDPPYLCRGGVCGQCETNVISYDGKFIHNDHWLSEEDHRSQEDHALRVALRGPVAGSER